MLRICFCLSHYHPVASGAERQAHRQARELVRRGHQVHVLTREVRGEPDEQCLDGVTIRRVIRPREMGPAFGLSFVATLSAALWRLGDEWDLIHCHQGLWEAVGSGFTRTRLNRPTLVQPAAGGEFGELHQLNRTRGRSLLKRLILRNDHFVAISRQIELELRHIGVPATRITRIASGIDVDEFCPGPSAVGSQLPPPPRVLFLGRLHAQKNLPVLLAAWQRVRARVPASLIIAGDGPERQQLIDVARNSNARDSIHFVGPVQALDYLRAADLFVLPSVAEGMSNSLLEAMAVGVPVIASRIGGNDDLIAHGQSGLLVDPADTDGWTESIVELICRRDEAAQLAARAREIVRSQYSIQAIVDRYLHLYRQLVDSRPAGFTSASG